MIYMDDVTDDSWNSRWNHTDFPVVGVSYNLSKWTICIEVISPMVKILYACDVSKMRIKEENFSHWEKY